VEALTQIVQAVYQPGPTIAQQELVIVKMDINKILEEFKQIAFNSFVVILALLAIIQLIFVPLVD